MSTLTASQKALDGLRRFKGASKLPSVSWWKRNWRSIPKRLKRLPRVLHLVEWIFLAVFMAIFAISLGVKLWRNNNTYLIDKPASGGELRIAVPTLPVSGAFLSLNAADRVINRLILAPLFSYDQNGDLVPVLAERYEVSADQKEITVALKQNLLWSDNQPVKAEDVVYTVQGLSDPENSNEAKFWNDVTAFAVNDKTVKFTLKEPYSLFAPHLTFGVLPSHISIAKEREEMVGAGPYLFSKRILNKDKSRIERIELTSNQNYVLGRPKINSLSLLFFDSLSEAEKAVKSGKADSLFTTDSFEFKQKKSMQFDTREVMALFLNTDRAPFNDVNVRRAIKNKSKLSNPAQALLITLNQDDAKKAAERAKSDLAALGVDVSVNALSQKEFAAAAAKREYELLLLPIQKGVNFDPYNYFHSSQASSTGQNYANLKKKEVDDTIMEIRRANSKESLKNAQNKLDEFINSEVPVVYLDEGKVILLAPEELKGVEPIKLKEPADLFLEISNWYLKERKVRIKK